jgi:hypothetical protein
MLLQGIKLYVEGWANRFSPLAQGRGLNDRQVGAQGQARSPNLVFYGVVAAFP